MIPDGMRPRRLAWLIVSALAIGSLFVILLAESLGGRSEPPPSGTPAATAAPERRTLAARIATHGTVTFAPAGSLSSPAGGVVTAIAVEPGDVVTAGTIILEVEGRPMVAISDQSVMWRPLRVGDSGVDVEWLQSMLAAEGFETTDSPGVFGDSTQEVLMAWQTAHEFPDADGAFRPTDVAIGVWPLRVGAVNVSRGVPFGDGAELLSWTDLEPSVIASVTPTERAELSVGLKVEATIGVNQSRDLGEIGALAATPSVDPDAGATYTLTVDSIDLAGVPEGAEVALSIVLREAIDALVVPVVAIVATADGTPGVIVIGPEGGETVVPVELGLSEGAYVELLAGLDGTEQVKLGS